MAKKASAAKGETPMMQQYKEIKGRYYDTILLFRVGDFYETFEEDAVKVSSILNITLTRRANGAASHIKLAGFPHHALNTYLPRLTQAGQRVAICDQLEDPKLAKGLVKRDVVELITPGVIIDSDSLRAKESIFLASIFIDMDGIGVAFIDVSTGEFHCSEGSVDHVKRLLNNFSPREVIVQRQDEPKIKSLFGDELYIYKVEDWFFSFSGSRDRLCRQFAVKSLRGFGIEDLNLAISAAGAILSYLEFTGHRELNHIVSISRFIEQDNVWLDRFTIRNLELLNTGSGHEGHSFVDHLDRTHTSMGGRLLRRWVVTPLRDRSKIEHRLDQVEALLSDTTLYNMVEDLLGDIDDIERTSSRIATGKVRPLELVKLGDSLEAIARIKIILTNSKVETLCFEASLLSGLDAIRSELACTLLRDPQSNNILKGEVVGTGVSLELDDLRNIRRRGHEVMRIFQQQEEQSTGIPSIKVASNNVIGFFFEIKAAYKDRVPDYWIARQELSGVARYTTSDLREYEFRVKEASSKILELELSIYNNLVERIKLETSKILCNAKAIARLDIMLSFASLARDYGYTRPEFVQESTLEIEQGRHPVIEANMPLGESYIPNSTHLSSDGQQIIILTGPNMSGKSALLRQTALLTIMAQIGSYTPSASSKFGIVDKIFTRVGASDNISQGESTFMVEMLESAAILNNATSKSLVLLDEVGRGTSTYDGVAIAWAMVEYLHNREGVRPKVLFATHYHELNEMESLYERVFNYHISVESDDDRVIFTRKFQPGGTESSFGVHVARMAGMPRVVVKRAGEILKQLEQNANREIISGKQSGESDRTQPTTCEVNCDPASDIGKEIINSLKALELNMVTPVEALLRLADLKDLAEGKSL
ncbi:MAG: DNA mismatch repair protein MutS [Rikenellaceae bacterium]